MSAQRLSIPLPIMLNADAHVESDSDDGYAWFVRILIGDSEIGRIKYSDSIRVKPSQEEVARVAADHLRSVFFSAK